VLEPLPALIREATAEPPRPKRRGAARRPRPEIPRSHPMPATPPAPPRVRPPALVVEALLTGRVTAARAAEVLRVGPGDVPAIASGRAGLLASAWMRVLRELGDVLKGVGG
jgi:hypothetical protein